MVQRAHGHSPLVPGSHGARRAVFLRTEQEAVCGNRCHRGHHQFCSSRGPCAGRFGVCGPPTGAAGPCWSPDPCKGWREQWGCARADVGGTAAWARRACSCLRKGEAVRWLSQRPPRAARQRGCCFPDEAPLLALHQRLEKSGLSAVSVLGELTRDASSLQGKSFSARDPSDDAGVVAHLPRGFLMKQPHPAAREEEVGV